MFFAAVNKDVHSLHFNPLNPDSLFFGKASPLKLPNDQKVALTGFRNREKGKNFMAVVRYTQEQKDLQRLLPGSNVNEFSFLATDYLNHLNEPVMILEMVPGMPDMLENVEEWQPKSYEQHFRDSMFGAKEIAIKAYKIAPAAYRQPFQMCITMAGNCLMDSTIAIRESINNENTVRAAFLVEQTSRHVRHLIDIASGAINGKPFALDRKNAMEIRRHWKEVLSDTLGETTCDNVRLEHESDSPSMDQNSIDDLFD